MTYEMCMLEKDLGCQKTFHTSESLFVMGPILFSSDECMELTDCAQTIPLQSNAFKNVFKWAISIRGQSEKQSLSRCFKLREFNTENWLNRREMS